MKRILSILCTMALVLSVVLIPGIFSASAAVEYVKPTTVVATDNSASGSCGPYLATGAYGIGKLQFNIELEANAQYAIAFDYDGENWDKFGVYAYAVADPAVSQSVEITTLTKKHRFDFQKKKKTMRRYANIVNANDLINGNNKYLALLWWNNEYESSIANVTVSKVPADSYAHPVYQTNKFMSDVIDGVTTHISNVDYGDHLMVFDEVVDPAATYTIKYEYKGKNGVDGGFQFAWTTVNSKTAPTAPNASYTKVAHPHGNVWVNDWTACTVTATGAELGATATNKYLALAAGNSVAADCYFRKIEITKTGGSQGGGSSSEITSSENTSSGNTSSGSGSNNDQYKNDGFLHPTYISSNIGESVKDNVVSYGKDSPIQGTGFMAFDYRLEAGAEYIIEMDHYGHRNGNSNKILIGATDSKTGTAFKGNTVVWDKGYSLNWSAYWHIGHMFKANDVISGNNNYLALSMVADNPCLAKNITITKVTKDNKYLYPSADGEAIHPAYMDGGIAYTNAHSYNTAAWMIYDYELQAGQTYQLTFDYKGSVNALSSNVPWSVTAASSTTAPGGFTTRFDNADLFSNKRVQIVSAVSKDAFTKVTIMFEADTVLADGYKYLAIVTSSYEGRASIKNLSIQTATMNGLMPSKYGDELMISMEDGEFVLGTKVEYGDRAWMKFNYELEPDTEYLLSYDFRGHNFIAPNGFKLVIGCVDDPFGTESPKNIVPTDKRIGGIDIANTQTVFTHKDIVFNSNDIINGNAKYFCLFGSGYSNKWSFKNIRLMKRPKQDGNSVLYNGTFDDAALGEQFWTDKANVAQRVTTENHTTAGVAALHVKGGEFDHVVQTAVLDKNTKYELSFWYKGSFGNNASVAIARDVPEFSRRYLAFYDILEDTTDWKQYKTVIDSGDYMVLNVAFGASTGDDYYIDDVVLAPVTTSANYNANTLIAEPYYNYVEKDVRYRHWSAKAGTNIIENGTMEGAIPASWGDFVSGSNGTLSIVDGQGYNGSNTAIGGKALKFEAKGLAEKEKNFLYFDVKPNTNYFLVLWTRTPYWSQDNTADLYWGIANPFDGNMYFTFRENVRGHKIVCNDNSWHRATFMFNSGDNKKLAFCVEGGNSTMYMDNLEIFEYGNHVDARPKVIQDSQNNLPKVTNTAPTEIYVSYAKNLVKNCHFNDSNLHFWAEKDALGFKGEFEKAGYVMVGDWTGTVDVADTRTSRGKALHYVVHNSITGKPTSTTYIKHFDVEPNTEYTFVVDYLITKKGAGRFALTATNSFMPIVFDKYIDFDSHYNANLPWQRYAVTFNTNAYEQISFIVQDRGGEAYFDNFALFKKGEGSTTPIYEVEPPYVEEEEDDTTSSGTSSGGTSSGTTSSGTSSGGTGSEGTGSSGTSSGTTSSGTSSGGTGSTPVLPPVILDGEIESTKYDVVEDTITGAEDQKLIEGVEEGTTVQEILNTLKDKQNIKAFDAEGNEITDTSAVVGTGYTFRYMDGISSLDSAVVLIRGDVNCDGVVNGADMKILMRAILNTGDVVLDQVDMIVADIDEDGKITSNDVALISAHIGGAKALEPVTVG